MVMHEGVVAAYPFLKQDFTRVIPGEEASEVWDYEWGVGEGYPIIDKPII